LRFLAKDHADSPAMPRRLPGKMANRERPRQTVTPGAVHMIPADAVSPGCLLQVLAFGRISP
jgi:hypothetical protein